MNPGAVLRIDEVLLKICLLISSYLFKAVKEPLFYRFKPKDKNDNSKIILEVFRIGRKYISPFQAAYCNSLDLMFRVTTF